MTRRIEILIFPEVQLLDATGPAQVFSSANNLAGRSGAKLYEVLLVAEDDEVTSNSGIALRCQALSPADPAPDTAIVAGGSGIGAACTRPALLDWTRHRAGEARRMASVCNGAFLLAEAGLLDGRRAVTHWNHCAEFAERYPRMRLEPDPIFVQDGQIWTSAGITAGIDLALAMVEEDHGHALALAVARERLVFLKRPGGQSQFSAHLALDGPDARFAELHAWIAANLTRPLTLELLADRAGMSPRSLSEPLPAAGRAYARGGGRADPGGAGAEPSPLGGDCCHSGAAIWLRHVRNDASGLPAADRRWSERMARPLPGAVGHLARVKRSS